MWRWKRRSHSLVSCNCYLKTYLTIYLSMETYDNVPQEPRPQGLPDGVLCHGPAWRAASLRPRRAWLLRARWRRLSGRAAPRLAGPPARDPGAARREPGALLLVD